MLRAGIWLLAVAVPFWPSPLLERIRANTEGALRTLARRPLWCCAGAALAVLLVRVALLVVWGIPLPFVHDEFGYLLQADTFASGRLTNPTHPMAEFFETPYIFQSPSYNAKFPPGQGLFLALGQLLFGHPWFGVWLSCGALAAALCWALQGYFRATYALVGTALILPLCIFSNWMNSYWGGAVAALGGALVFGAVPRLRAGSTSAAAILASGGIVLLLTRPFEGSLVLFPVLFVLPFRLLTQRQWIAVTLPALAGLAFWSYYNLRVTGDSLRVPYTEYEVQYPMTSHFNILPLPPPKDYARPGITWVDHWEREAWSHARTPGFFLRRLEDLWSRAGTFLGSALLLTPMFWFAAQWWRDRGLRAAGLAVMLSVAVAFIEVLYFDHYAAPALAPLLIVVVAGLSHLRKFQFSETRIVGTWLACTLPAAALASGLIAPAGALVTGRPILITPAGGREYLENLLADELGPHLVLVQHTNPRGIEPNWSLFPRIEAAPVLIEFVHNGANIDKQYVVWANDLGEKQNRRLREYYKDRKVWVYRPEQESGLLHRFPSALE